MKMRSDRKCVRIENRSYRIQFTEVPPDGTVMAITHRTGTRIYTLVHTQPYRRKSDGRLSHILHWRDEDGQVFTSGLNAKSLVRSISPWERLLRLARSLRIENGSVATLGPSPCRRHAGSSEPPCVSLHKFFGIRISAKWI